MSPKATGIDNHYKEIDQKLKNGEDEQMETLAKKVIDQIEIMEGGGL